MSGSVGTELGRPSEDPATRADAIRYLTRTGNADLLPILGLDDTPVRKVRYSKGLTRDVRPAKPVQGYEVRNGKTYCIVCARRTQSDGRCRRRECGGAR